MTDRLTTRLADLGRHIDWPTSDLRGPVQARLVARPAPARKPIALGATAAAVVLVAAIMTPLGREAIAEVLGVVGIEVRWSAEVPAVVPSGILDLGREVSLGDAASSIDFPILVPRATSLPDGVFVHDRRVTTVWYPDEELPEVGDTGVGLLHVQFRASIDQDLLSKRLGPDSEYSAVTVRGVTGFWIDDAPHVVVFVDGEGNEREETIRLAGNVLLWEEDGVTHRIESVLERDRVLALAASMRTGG